MKSWQRRRYFPSSFIAATYWSYPKSLPTLLTNTYDSIPSISLIYYTGVTSVTNFLSRALRCNLGKTHVFIYQVTRTVATLLTAWQNAASASSYCLQKSSANRVVDIPDIKHIHTYIHTYTYIYTRMVRDSNNFIHS